MAGELLGFIGIGRMGGPMTSRLLDAGYTLCVYDKDSNAVAALAARGAKVANSPAEVASSAEIVLISCGMLKIRSGNQPLINDRLFWLLIS